MTPLIFPVHAFIDQIIINRRSTHNSIHRHTLESSNQHADDVSSTSIEEASRILGDWDRLYNPENSVAPSTSMEDLLPNLKTSVLFLNECASEERAADSTMGRCMLGICAPTAADGIQALKSWVSSLELPRGLLHGMDKDGVPLEGETNGPCVNT